MSDKVLLLPASTTFTVNRALDSAKQADLKEVLIIGTDEQDFLYVRSSRMTCKEALWLAEKLRNYALSGGEFV